MTRHLTLGLAGAVCALGLILLLGQSATAASYTWDASTGAGDPGPNEGGGPWTTTDSFWYDGTNNVSWSNSSDAVFGAGVDGNGTAAPVTLGEAITVGTLTFNPTGSGGGNYTVAGSGTNVLTINNGVNTNLSATIGAVTLGGSQTWTTASGQTLTVTGNVTNGANLLTIGGDGNTLVSGIIGAGAGGLTKSGSGLLTLAAANTYTGTTTISAGTLQVGTGSTTGSLVSATIINNGALVYNRSNTIDINLTSISGTGSITANAGAGTIGFRASSGTIQAGSITASSTYASSGQALYGSNYASAINLFTNSIFTSGNQTYNGVVSIGRGSTNPTTSLTTTGGGGVTITGGVVSGVSGYWSAGILNIDTSAGNGPVSLGGTTLSYGVANLNISSGTGNITLTGGNYYYSTWTFGLWGPDDARCCAIV